MEITNYDIRWDESRGRWLCATLSDAITCVDMHAGDSVYLYDRVKGKETNIRPYWTPTMSDKHKMPNIKSGKIRA